jgi:predicted nucleic acid-binding protein
VSHLEHEYLYILVGIMKAKVYIETSVISYLTSRPSQDIVIAGHQQTTRDWWATYRAQFDVVASQLVVQEASAQEASAGDPQAAQQRLAVLAELELLAVTEEAIALAHALVEGGPLPAQAAEDALHIAIAVTNGIEYLITWNCKHLANASMRKDIDRICRLRGYEPIVICTPEELIEG